MTGKKSCESICEGEDEDLVSMLNFDIPFREFDGFGSDEMDCSVDTYQGTNIDFLF